MRFVKRNRLEDFCLLVIVQNLERIVESKNIPQRHIDFLLRTNGEKLYRMYYYDHDISERYLLWFLNPHSRKVIINTVSFEITRQLSVVGPNITSLSLFEVKSLDRRIDAILRCVPHVTHLDLSGTFCDNRTLLCIGKTCHAIINLNLYRCLDVTNRGVKYLCSKNLPLKYLNLTRTAVDPPGLSIVLKSMPQLLHLKHSQLTETLYEMHEKDFVGNSSPSIYYNFTELYYEYVSDHLNPSRVLYVWSVLCPNITKVNLHFTFTGEALEMCTRFQNLKELKISYQHTTEQFISLFRMVTDFGYLNSKLFVDSLFPTTNKLTTLTLHNVEIPALIILKLPENLKKLALDSVHFNDSGQESIGKENKLETLDIRRISLDHQSTYKAIVILLSASKNVSKLVLNEIRFMPCDIPNIVLQTMKKLSFVDFSYSTINPEFPSFVNFFYIPSLKTLRLRLLNVTSLNEADEKRLVSPTPTSSFAWCEGYDSSDDSEDEDYLFHKLY